MTRTAVLHTRALVAFLASVGMILAATESPTGAVTISLGYGAAIALAMGFWWMLASVAVSIVEGES